MSAINNIEVPYKFTPRDYQWPVLNSVPQKYSRGFCIWHRRAGKDKTMFNKIIIEAFKTVGVYYYFLPTLKQGKKVIWHAVGKGFKLLDHIPKQLIKKKNETEMFIELVNGSIVQIIGSDNYDSFMGVGLMGAVFSEFSLSDPKAWEYVRPIITESKGWALFNSTPRGKNHAFKLFEKVKDNPRWFTEILTVEDTNQITQEQIQADRDEGMSEEMIQQEYYCSFESPMEGSYYAAALKETEQEGRVRTVSYDRSLRVHTAWDIGLGKDDDTAIWFFQVSGTEIHLIDYYSHNELGIDHYAKIINKKNYVYGTHLGPHDLKKREWGNNATRRLKAAQDIGINFKVVPKVAVEDGITAVRSIFGRCWFDKLKTQTGRDSLAAFCREYDSKHDVFNEKPVRNWAKHGADAFMYLAVGLHLVQNFNSGFNYKKKRQEEIARRNRVRI